MKKRKEMRGSPRARRKKGMTTLEAVIGSLIFIMLFAGLLDMLTLSNRYTVMNSTAKELARTVSVQGGALCAANRPPSYTSNYYTAEQLAQNVKQNMEDAGFRAGEWAVIVEYDRMFDLATNTTVVNEGGAWIQKGWIGYDTGKNFRSDETPYLDYLSRFNIKIVAVYEWKALPAFLGDIRKTKMQVTLPGVSEWKYNYDQWEGEV